jgi:hypothetical protein
MFLLSSACLNAYAFVFKLTSKISLPAPLPDELSVVDRIPGDWFAQFG